MSPNQENGNYNKFLLKMMKYLKLQLNIVRLELLKEKKRTSQKFKSRMK
jgi:hypothetical protein